VEVVFQLPEVLDSIVAAHKMLEKIEKTRSRSRWSVIFMSLGFSLNDKKREGEAQFLSSWGIKNVCLNKLRQTLNKRAILLNKRQ
jgi:hypothetical protein